MKTGEMCVAGGRKGRVAEIKVNTVVVDFTYRQEEFPRYEVLEFIPLKDENENKDLSKILAFVEKVADSTLQGEKVTLQDGVIWGYHNSVSLEPAVVEVKSIGRVMEVAGWTVTTWKQTYGSRWEPPDVDDHTVGEFTNWKTAAAACLKTVFDMRVDDEVQGLCDTEYAESLKEELS